MMEKGSAASLKAAQEAAAKVNAMLVASGQLKLSELSKRSKNNKSNDLFIDEVVINDTPMSARNFLTRSSTQEEISKMSGAAVSTRGRYMSPEERKTSGKKSIDRPLYLHIQAVNQQDVKVAVGRIMHIIMEHSHRKGPGMQRPRGPRPNPAPGLMGPRPGSGPRGPRPLVFRPSRPDMSAPPPQTQPPPPVVNILREKVFLPVNIGINPSDIRARLIGESGTNLRYIEDETGVSISVRGIGSGYHEAGTGQEAQDSLHFYLEHDNQDKFNEAKDLVVNLAQTVIAEIQQELQQHQQQQTQQMQQPAPLFSQPPPQQPEVALGGGGMGQPHLGPVQMAPHQLATQQAPPPQMVHSQMVPPQVPPHSQLMPPHVGHPQMAPGQVTIQSQVGGGQVNSGVLHHPGMAPHGAGVAPEVMQQPEVVVSVSQQVVHLAPSVVSSAPTVPGQQLVHTSSGTQLVTLPPGTQIVNTPEGPRLVALAAGAPGHQVTGPVAPVSATHQPLVSMSDHQTVPGPFVPQQPAPQSMSASMANNHLAINPTPGYGDQVSLARPPGPTVTYSSPVMANAVNTANLLTSAAPNGSHDASFPPNVNGSLPPTSSTPALGMPPPGPNLALTPAVSAHAGTVSFVVTPSVNTLTTTSGVGLIVSHDPNAANQLHTGQPVVVTGVIPASQQQQSLPYPTNPTPTPSTFVGPVAPQPMGPSGYPSSQPPMEQPSSSAYLSSEQGYSAPPITSNATQHYAHGHQQHQRPLSVNYNSGTTDPGSRVDMPGPGGHGGMHPHLMVNNMQRHQGQKVEQPQAQPHPASGYYGPRPGPQEPRPGVSLEQQWQQFQQQVKMEGGAGGGQQQYDPYSASDDTDHHDLPRHPQANSVIPTQQPSLPSHGQQQPQMAVPQQPNSQTQQGSDTRQMDNRSPKGFNKGDMKAGGRGSPHGSYSYYFGGRQPQLRTGPSSPDRAEHPQQPGGEARFSQPGIGSADISQRGSPQGQGNHPQGQPQYHQGPFHGQSPQRNPDGGPQTEDQYPHAKTGEVVGPVYPQQVTPQPGHHHHPHPSQQQQELAAQGLPEGQFPQGPPQQSQQYPPGGQYPWAQYPQPTGPSTFVSEPGPYSNGPAGPFTGPGGPNVSQAYSISGPDTFPEGPVDERQPVFPDKKADPGVGRDMTTSLLMPPPPPPPLTDAPGNVRGRESPDSSMLKRQRSCSPKDEWKYLRRSMGDPDEPGSHDVDNGGRLDGPGASFPGRGGPGAGSFMGLGGSGSWGEWGAPIQGPYSGMPLGSGPYHRTPGGGRNHGGMRNHRDRSDLEEVGGGGGGGGGGGRRGRLGGRMGSYSLGGRGGRDRRW
ncbi:hypothetical protein Pmani_019629 [Petrolisthes manimaculis]|uniref:KH homology domain-containing protein 4 n=1 Tax=Petrolisthes manimaculis TaxID=1843537 RepID=A0AAE1PIH2_9EUCA|nr:hypothetical protein Pmani_019629 [Petrolisthes manimaculis]